MKLFYFLLLFTLSAASFAQTNIALNKSVTASTREGATRTAAYAVDGKLTTRWASKAADPQWLRIDLGTIQPINKVILKWERAYAKSYRIETSNDDKTWTTVYSNTNSNGGNQTIEFNASARYVRLMCLTRATGWAYSLYEVEIYSPTASSSSSSKSSSSVSSAVSSSIVSSSSSSKSSVVSSSSASSVSNSLTLSWSAPTSRENGINLKIEEIGGYEIRGFNSNNERKYTHTITNGRTLQHSILLTSTNGATRFEIAAYDINNLYSKFVAVVPVSEPKPPCTCE
jgi:hypothetical protein